MENILFTAKTVFSLTNIWVQYILYTVRTTETFGPVVYDNSGVLRARGFLHPRTKEPEYQDNYNIDDNQETKSKLTLFKK